MEIFSQISDPSTFKSASSSMDKQDSSSLSDASTASSRPTSHSDVEVYSLATSRPKKKAGRRVFKETRHPIFRGVRRRNNNKWVCELREPNKKSRIWLGTYPTPEMAARAHDVATLALRGKSACLNYADSAWRLPLPASNDAKDIRKAAAEAAAAFRPDQDQIEAAAVSDRSDNIVEVSHEEGGRNIKTYSECEDHKLKEVKTLQEYANFGQINDSFMDEEALFDMPALLVHMAEGLLVSPPPLFSEDDDMKWNRDVENNGEVSLWSH